MSEQKTLSPDLLVCGVSLRLLALETTKSKWTARFIGACPGRYLVVEMPKVAGGPVKLDDGTRWAAHFIHKGAVYSFNTDVLGYTYRLAPLLFLSYPEEVTVDNLRMEKRYPVSIPTISRILKIPVSAAGDAPDIPGDPVKSLVVDISEGGFMMASPVVLPMDTLVEATFFLPREVPLAGIRALVRTCRGKAGGCFIGLAYTPDNKPESITHLGDLITNIENMPLRL